MNRIPKGESLMKSTWKKKSCIGDNKILAKVSPSRKRSGNGK